MLFHRLIRRQRQMCIRDSAIADVATGSSGGHQDVPLEVITIESVTVAE